MTDHIDIVFDGPPAPSAGRLVEVEDSSGCSISIGDWFQRDDGYWVLRIPDPRPKPPSRPIWCCHACGSARISYPVCQDCGTSQGDRATKRLARADALLRDVVTAWNTSDTGWRFRAHIGAYVIDNITDHLRGDDERRVGGGE
jgi:hypothetical protein